MSEETEEGATLSPPDGGEKKGDALPMARSALRTHLSVDTSAPLDYSGANPTTTVAPTDLQAENELGNSQTEDSNNNNSNGANVPMVTSATSGEELKSIESETVGNLGGWTAKRVSVTGQLFFERDVDGKISIDRPAEALDAVRQAEEQEAAAEREAMAQARSEKTPEEPRANEQEKNVEVTESDAVVETKEAVIETEAAVIETKAAVVEAEMPTSGPSIPEQMSSTSNSAIEVKSEESQDFESAVPIADYLSDKPVPLTSGTVDLLRAHPGNDRCVDCGVGRPDWASLSFGVLLCVACSGSHRAWGSHISVVKSLTLDNWTAEQLAYIYPFGGNSRFCNSVKLIGKPSARYTTDDAAAYRAQLRALVKKEPLRRISRSALPSPHSSVSSSGLASLASGTNPQTPRRNLKMQQDSKEATVCLLCGRAFSVVTRKYICRNCDRAVCSRCAPPANTKPLPHLGLGMTPQRHCFRCYRSPFIDWSSAGLSAAEIAAEVQILAQTISSSERSAEAAPVIQQRRKTLSEKKLAQARRKTFGDMLMGMMKRG